MMEMRPDGTAWRMHRNGKLHLSASNDGITRFGSWHERCCSPVHDFFTYAFAFLPHVFCMPAQLHALRQATSVVHQQSHMDRISALQ